MSHDSEIPSTWDKPKPRIYPQKQPSQAFRLYRGFGEIIYQTEKEDKAVEGNCEVRLEWHPSPSIKIYFTAHHSEGDIPLGEADLKLTELGLENRVKIHLWQSRGKGDGESSLLIGKLKEPFYSKNLSPISSLIFHVTNFEFFNINNCYPWEEENKTILEGWGNFDGQFIFQDSEWRIILCTLDTCWDLQEMLEAQGGYGITHICKLERTDKKLFRFEDALNRVEAFIYYLSFARGLWVAPIMFAGYDESGILTFEKWENVDKRTDSWRNQSCWFEFDSTDLPDLFPGFLKLWSDESWKEVLKVAIELFIESFKQSSGISASIILQVAALERLGWAYLVSFRKAMSADGFGKITASDKIQLLLSSLNCNLDLDAAGEHFPILNREAKSNNRNLIEHMIEVRNKIVHPPKTKTASNRPIGFDSEELEEVWVLGHEILLACLFGLIHKNFPESPDNP